MPGTSRPRPLSRTAARAGAIAIAALALGGALAACGSAHPADGNAAALHAAGYSAAAAVHRQPATAAQGPAGTPAAGSAAMMTGPDHAGNAEASSYLSSITLHVTNTSNQVLHFVKVDLVRPHQVIDPAPVPGHTVGGNGGTDTISVYGTDAIADMHVTYRVGDTEQELEGDFYVPAVGTNTAECGMKASPDCTIEHGTYHPNAHWTITPSQVPASLGPAGTVWSFTKTGAAGSPQLLEVNEALAGLGLYKADTWEQTMNGNAIQANQLWTYRPEPGGTGYGQLVSNDYDGYCLQAINTTDVDAKPCTDGAASQLWRAVPGQAEGYGLQVKSSGAYLGVTDPGTGNGDYAQMHNQQQSSLTDWAGTPAS